MHAGMKCGGCVSHVRKILEAQEGVSEVGQGGAAPFLLFALNLTQASWLSRVTCHRCIKVASGRC